jgi:RNA polymerase sigma-70 factor (ECF subfamily)
MDPDANRQPGRVDDLEEATAAFMGVRPRLFGIAYRMLGSASEAEDLLQEAWVRWQTYDRATVVNPYLGAERGEALEFAALLLMDKLTPHERAAYVLREAFDYPYAQIADILGATEPAVRQLVSRARKHMASERRVPVSKSGQRELLATFIAAARTGDMQALERLLAADATNVSDGNGRRQVARRLVTGAPRVAKFLVAMSWFWDGVDVQWAETNGQTSAVLRRDGEVYGLLTVSASADGIDQVLWMVNPEKNAAVPAAR